jgi:hypothetical protein
MSPLRWDVLLVGFVLALPVLALYLRGDLTAEELVNRVLWCLAAGWGAVALLRWASTPRPTRPKPRALSAPLEPTSQDDERSPAT